MRYCYASAQSADGDLEASALQLVLEAHRYTFSPDARTIPGSSFSALTFFNAFPSFTTKTASAVTDSTVAPI
jgi:hypothetical protein